MLTSSSTQKAGEKPIVFYLDRSAVGIDGLVSVPLYIRPEELTRTQPSRMAVQQTLGGAWVDNFGPGIYNLQISGHTGWRGTLVGDDGITLFQTLNETIFDAWHLYQQYAVELQIDPSEIKLSLSDSLNGYVYEVATSSFTLKRSKSRPLLMMYTINLLVIDANFSSSESSESSIPTVASLMASLGLDSLKNALNQIKGYVTMVQTYVRAQFATIKAFIATITSTYNKLYSVIAGAPGDLRAEFATLLSTARSLAGGGANVCRIYAASATSTAERAAWMSLGAQFTNLYCLTSNTFKVKKTYPVYAGLYGSSNCSSTNGGAAVSEYSAYGTNTWEVVAPTVAQPISLTTEARTHLDKLASADVVSGGLTKDSALTSMAIVSSRITVAA